MLRERAQYRWLVQTEFAKNCKAGEEAVNEVVSFISYFQKYPDAKSPEESLGLPAFL